MYLGRVVGSVWCTVKDPALTGCRLLVVQPLTPELRHTGKRLICVDSTGAGAGELVYWVRGKEASFPFASEPPVDTTVVGIVDEVHVQRTVPAQAEATGQLTGQLTAKTPAPQHRRSSRKEPSRKR